MPIVWIMLGLFLLTRPELAAVALLGVLAAVVWIAWE